MLCRRIYLQLLLSVVLVFVSSVGIAVFSTPPADAKLQLHHDAPGQIHYHSQQSLLDRSGHAWQVVLFKQFRNEPTAIHLRLVGFPGVVEVAHPQPLEIITAKGQIFTAADVYPEKSPAVNVGEYNLTDVLPKLGSDRLEIWIKVKGESLAIEIPAVLVQEWQWLASNV